MQTVGLNQSRIQKSVSHGSSLCLRQHKQLFALYQCQCKGWLCLDKTNKMENNGEAVQPMTPEQMILTPRFVAWFAMQGYPDDQVKLAPNVVLSFALYISKNLDKLTNN